MKLSPLQLEAYALVDLACRANQEHTPADPIAYADTDLAVTTTCRREAPEAPRWQVGLGVNLQPRSEANAPYAVSLHLTGVIRVMPDAAAGDLEAEVQVNGATLLYGVARELVRQVTCVGPFAPVILPTMTFQPDAPAADPATP